MRSSFAVTSHIHLRQLQALRSLSVHTRCVDSGAGSVLNMNNSLYEINLHRMFFCAFVKMTFWIYSKCSSSIRSSGWIVHYNLPKQFYLQIHLRMNPFTYSFYAQFNGSHVVRRRMTKNNWMSSKLALGIRAYGVQRWEYPAIDIVSGEPHSKDSKLQWIVDRRSNLKYDWHHKFARAFGLAGSNPIGIVKTRHIRAHSKNGVSSWTFRH